MGKKMVSIILSNLKLYYKSTVIIALNLFIYLLIREPHLAVHGMFKVISPGSFLWVICYDGNGPGTKASTLLCNFSGPQ